MLKNYVKKCTKCNQIKSIKEFYENTSRCKKCISEYQKNCYRKAHPNRHIRNYQKYKYMPPSNTPEYQRELKKRKWTTQKRMEVEFKKLLKTQNLRKCYKCKTIKFLYEFNRRSSESTGYAFICKKCQKQYYKEWSTKNKRNRNKKAEKAGHEIFKALKNNNIKKPNKCEICSKLADVRAHHPDYSKPLNVIWVCRRCHKKLHSKSFALDKS